MEYIYWLLYFSPIMLTDILRLVENKFLHIKACMQEKTEDQKKKE